jgi:hypothetical protein
MKEAQTQWNDVYDNGHYYVQNLIYLLYSDSKAYTHQEKNIIFSQ